MRTLRMLLLILCCYLVGWVTADLLVPIVVANRTDRASVPTVSQDAATGAATASTHTARPSTGRAK